VFFHGDHAVPLAVMAHRLAQLIGTHLKPVADCRFRQLLAGKKIAPRPAVLDEAWLAGAELPQKVPLIVGGRSAGARVACRTGVTLGARAVVALSFPLHPPGKPEKSRLEELTGAGVPTLVVQGQRDAFGRPEEFGAGPFTIVKVAHADHGMAVPKANDQHEALSTIVRAVREFVLSFAG
jgi:uncharacterized protein